MRLTLHLIFFQVIALSMFISAQTVSTFAGPGISINDGLIQAADGTIYGSRFGGDTVYKVSTNGMVTPYATGFAAPNGLEFDADSNLVVCDHFGNTIYKVPPGGGTPVVFVENIITPAGVIKDPLSDTLYVVQYNTNQLVKVASDGSVVPFIDGNNMDGPVGLAWDDSNRLYVANFNDGKIFRVDGNSLNQIATIPGNSFSAIGFIAYGQGKIYATGIARHQIFQVDLATNERTVLAGSGVRGSVNGPAADARFNTPNGILFDKRDNSLYISDAQTSSLRQVTGILTGISVESQPGLAEAYQLGQNYPNPFNPATTIPFSLPVHQQVQITLYDMSGRLVQNLLNTTLPAGQHQLTFDLQNLASGVYTYRITAGEFQQVKQMILQK